MSKISIDGAWMKLQWAKRHLDTVRELVTEFLESDPYGVDVEYYDDIGQQVFFLRIFKQVPTHLSLAIGDCVQNARAALDYLIWQLAIKGTDGRPPERITFPIFKNRAGFDNWLKGYAKVLPSGAQQHLRGSQPYFRAQGSEKPPRWEWDERWEGAFVAADSITRPEDDPLWLLRELSNSDKHRLLAVVAAVGYVDPTFHQLNRNIRFRVWPPGPIQDGVEIARYYFRFPDESRNHGYVKPDFKFGVAFEQAGPGAGHRVLSTLDGALLRVHLILDRFDHQFR